VGCATIQPLNTQSGKPEIVVKNLTKNEVKEILVNSWMQNGVCTLISENDYQLVFRENCGYNSFYSRVDLIFSFTIIKAGANIKIISDIKALINPGTINQVTYDKSRGGQVAEDVQYLLKKDFHNYLSIFSY